MKWWWQLFNAGVLWFEPVGNAVFSWGRHKNSWNCLIAAWSKSSMLILYWATHFISFLGCVKFACNFNQYQLRFWCLCWDSLLSVWGSGREDSDNTKVILVGTTLSQGKEKSALSTKVLHSFQAEWIPWSLSQVTWHILETGVYGTWSGLPKCLRASVWEGNH